MSQFAKLFEAVKAQPKPETQPLKPAKQNPPKAEKAITSEKDLHITQTQKKTHHDETVNTTNDPGEQKTATNVKTPAETSQTASLSTPVQVMQNLPASTGRGIGKSRNADYTQVLTYIRKDTHRQIKKILIDDPQERDLSELVEELLTQWINVQKNS